MGYSNPTEWKEFKSLNPSHPSVFDMDQETFGIRTELCLRFENDTDPGLREMAVVNRTRKARRAAIEKLHISERMDTFGL